MPTALQAGQYSAVLNYLRAVEKSGSDNVKDVMNTLQNMPIHDGFARNAKLRKDGKLLPDLYVVSVKSPAKSKDPWDYYKVVKIVPGEQDLMPFSDTDRTSTLWNSSN